MMSFLTDIPDVVKAVCALVLTALLSFGCGVLYQKYVNADVCITPSDVDDALREAEERHARELAAAQQTWKDAWDRREVEFQSLLDELDSIDDAYGERIDDIDTDERRRVDVIVEDAREDPSELVDVLVDTFGFERFDGGVQ